MAWFGKHCLTYFCLWDTVISCFGLWDTAQCLVDKKLKINLSSRHRTVSHRPKYDITVSYRQKHAEQCLPDQATNKECPTDTIINHGIYYCKATNKYKNEGGMSSNHVINRPTIVVSSLNLGKKISKNIKIMLYATPTVY
jgi:hypothetical protein